MHFRVLSGLATNLASEHFVLFLLSPTAVHVSESRIQGRPGTRLKCLALSAPTLKEGPFDHLDS